MAEATMFISPRYNVGERCAGGGLTIYTDHTMQMLVPLWRYADLQLSVDGSGALPNPVPIDNNGIVASAVFYDTYENPSAWYVLRDAKNAIIRQGYVSPASWQQQGGGGTPPAQTGFWGVGDDFWGYEISTIGGLAGRGDIGRPLFLQTSVAADESGGLVVYFIPGATGADNILTFAGSGGIWKARSEWINYSYLLNRNVEGFDFINNNYQGQYNIVVDALPSQNQVTNTSIIKWATKIRFDRPLYFNTNFNGVKIALSGDENSIEFTRPDKTLPLMTGTSGSFTPNQIPFEVFGAAGDVCLQDITCVFNNTGANNLGMPTNFISGHFGTVYTNPMPYGSYYWDGLNIDYLHGAQANLPSAFFSGGGTYQTPDNAPYNFKIKRVNTNCLQYFGGNETNPNMSYNSSAFNQYVDELYIPDSYFVNIAVNVDNAEGFKTKVIKQTPNINDGKYVFLMSYNYTKWDKQVDLNNPNYFGQAGPAGVYVEPSDRGLRMHWSVRCSNAEALNRLNSVANEVGFVQVGGDGNPPLFMNRHLNLPINAAGNLVIDSVNTGKVYVNSNNVNISRLRDNSSLNPGNATVYAKMIGDAAGINNDITIEFEPSLFDENIGRGQQTAVSGIMQTGLVKGCRVNIVKRYAGIGWGYSNNRFYATSPMYQGNASGCQLLLMNSKFENCQIGLGIGPIFSARSSFKSCFIGRTSNPFSTNQQTLTAASGIIAMNDFEMVNCKWNYLWIDVWGTNGESCDFAFDNNGYTQPARTQWSNEQFLSMSNINILDNLATSQTLDGANNGDNFSMLSVNMWGNLFDLNSSQNFLRNNGPIQISNVNLHGNAGGNQDLIVHLKSMLESGNQITDYNNLPLEQFRGSVDYMGDKIGPNSGQYFGQTGGNLPAGSKFPPDLITNWKYGSFYGTTLRDKSQAFYTMEGSLAWQWCIDYVGEPPKYVGVNTGMVVIPRHSTGIISNQNIFGSLYEAQGNNTPTVPVWLNGINPWNNYMGVTNTTVIPFDVQTIIADMKVDLAMGGTRWVQDPNFMPQWPQPLRATSLGYVNSAGNSPENMRDGMKLDPSTQTAAWILANSNPNTMYINLVNEKTIPSLINWTSQDNYNMAIVFWHDGTNAWVHLSRLPWRNISTSGVKNATVSQSQLASVNLTGTPQIAEIMSALIGDTYIRLRE